MAKALQAPGPFLAIMLEKYNLNPFKLSKDIHLSQSAVRLITIGKTKITVPVAMRLAKYFNTNPEFWLAMQMKWDIAEASNDKALVKILKNISRVSKSAAGGAKKTAKKATAKKPAAKRKTAKKTTAKKPAARKTAAKRPAAKKRIAAARKPVAKKRAVVKTRKKPAARKPVARKSAAVKTRKPVAKKAKAKAKTTARRGRPAKKR